MQTLNFTLNQQSFEIFPDYIANNSKVVYHGTCSYHSKNIEDNGLVIHTPAYKIDDAKILCAILESIEFSSFDSPKGFFKWTTAQSMRHYIHHCIEAEDFKISFSALSGECLLFTHEQSKGGQAMGDIRKAKEIIDAAILQDNSLTKFIPEEVNNLFNQLLLIDNSFGVVYAIELSNDFENILDENGVIYSKANIPKENILAKVLVPATFVVPFSRTDAINKRMEKMYGARGLGRILNQFREGTD